MSPSSSEQATYLKFQQLYTWGFKEIWDKLPGEQTLHFNWKKKRIYQGINNFSYNYFNIYSEYLLEPLL